MAALHPETDKARLIARDLEQQPAGRFGNPEEFGAACAFLCGASSGYINGQNLLLDGGAFPGSVR
jgi:3-oxoacyl-[acyl-carrier protein] reductase